MSTAIAERIIRRELAREPQITLDLIAEALRLAAGTAEITLHINPTDYENLGSQIDRLAETLCQLAPSEIVADPDISAGGCRVETKFGEIDQQIESQLRRIEEELDVSTTASMSADVGMEANLLDNLNETMTASLVGSVVETIGMTVAVADFPAPVGAVVRIERDGDAGGEGEVVGFRDGLTLVYLLTRDGRRAARQSRAARANQSARCALGRRCSAA